MSTLLLAVLLTAGCVSLEDRLNAASSESAQARGKALRDLSEWLRHAPPGSERHAAEREQLATFLLEHCEPAREPSGVIRSQLVSLALQGELSSAGELLMRAARDPHPLVRLVALQGLRELQPEGTRELLLERLASDPDGLVRIEAAKTLGRVGDRSVARALVLIAVDPAQEPDLRHQAHRAACLALGEERAPTGAAWHDWLEQNP